MKKVSFDFDSTLSVKKIEAFAKYLIDKGVEVWVVTSRDAFREDSPNYNDDLFLVTDKLGIPRHHIHFTAHEDKQYFLGENDFLFHIDDDVIELSLIKSFTKVEPICHYDWGLQYGGKKEWRNKCLKILNFKK